MVWKPRGGGLMREDRKRLRSGNINSGGAREGLAELICKHQPEIRLSKYQEYLY